jgi:hypothetical protein
MVPHTEPSLGEKCFFLEGGVPKIHILYIDCGEDDDGGENEDDGDGEEGARSL